MACIRARHRIGTCPRRSFGDAPSCAHAPCSATIRAEQVETLVIALSIMAAAAGTIVAVVVLTKVVRLSPDARSALRPWSTAGFRWLLLGAAATAVFALLDLSLTLPLFVMLAGIAATMVSMYRRWKRRG